MGQTIPRCTNVMAQIIPCCMNEGSRQTLCADVAERRYLCPAWNRQSFDAFEDMLSLFIMNENVFRC